LLSRPNFNPRLTVSLRQVCCFSALAVPVSLHASLMARLDRLGPAKVIASDEGFLMLYWLRWYVLDAYTDSNLFAGWFRRRASWSAWNWRDE
jgi:hypothetical protein